MSVVFVCCYCLYVCCMSCMSVVFVFAYCFFVSVWAACLSCLCVIAVGACMDVWFVSWVFLCCYCLFVSVWAACLSCLCNCCKLTCDVCLYLCATVYVCDFRVHVSTYAFHYLSVCASWSNADTYLRLRVSCCFLCIAANQEFCNVIFSAASYNF